MARTHAAGTVRFHQDDGVVLGKGGVPIPTTPTRGIPALYPHGQPVVQHMDEGEIVAPPSKPEPVVSTPTAYEWRCDRTTWGRSLDGFQALHLLGAMMEKLLGIELSVVLTDEEARKLPADTRWHFKRQIQKVAPVKAVVPQPVVPAEKPLTAKTAGALGSDFDDFALGALALGGDWTLARLRDLGVVTEGVEMPPDVDLRSLQVRMMSMRKRGVVESLGSGLWRLAVKETAA